MIAPIAKVCGGALLTCLLLVSCAQSTSDTSSTAETATGTSSTEANGDKTSDSPTVDAVIPNWPPTLLDQRTIAMKLKVPWDAISVDGAIIVSTRDSGEILQIEDEGGSRVVYSVSSSNEASSDPKLGKSNNSEDSNSEMPAGEGGLLGLAYSSGDGLFAYQTFDNVNRVIHFDVSQVNGEVSLGTPTVVLDRIPAGAIHNGGRLAFGPDGHLYVSTGDTGTLDGSLAQNESSLAGKILRIAPDGSIPSDNPIPNSPVWSLGHRNVQGMAWSSDGIMFATEFGANTWDELNVIEPGLNYGWPEVEGIAGVEGYQDPVQQWAPSEASPSGMTIANDVLYIANLRGESVRAVPVSNPNVSQIVLQGEGRIRAVALSPEGKLWVLTNNTDGRGTPGKKDDQLLEVSIH